MSAEISFLLARRPQFLAFLRRRVSPAVAEDLLQTAYLRLFERGVSARDEAHLAGWFFRVLRNAIIDHLRSTHRKRRLHCQLATQPLPVAPDEDELGARTEVTKALIASLAPTYREALEVIYLEGASIEHLARRSGITCNAARVRVHRARRALGSLLQEAA